MESLTSAYKENFEKEIRERLRAEFERKYRSDMEEIRLNEQNELIKRRKEIANLEKMLVDSNHAKIELEEKIKNEKQKTSKEKEIYENKIVEIVRKWNQLKSKIKQKMDFEKKFMNEQELRKKIQNDFMDYKGKIRVYCRIRPLSLEEEKKGEKEVVKLEDEFTLSIGENQTQKYDWVYGPESSQEDLFEDTQTLIQSAVDGKAVSIFAYGATGSGKTHTILGGKDEMKGLCPRSISKLFSMTEELKKNGFRVHIQCSMVELYWNNLNDLLFDKYCEENKISEKHPRMRIMFDKNTKRVIIENCTVLEWDNKDTAQKTFEDGISSRKTASTNFNHYSSRSHLIFSLYINIMSNNGKTTQGKLTFIDLAGSENLKHEDNKERMLEGMAVNQSLSALKNVISDLSRHTNYISYRGNKLTEILQDSIGGTAKTLVIVSWFFKELWVDNWN